MSRSIQEQIKAAEDLMNSLPPQAKAALEAKHADYARRKAQEVAAELARRETEALRLYRPTEIQDRYHKCTTKEVLFQAGNQVGKSLAGFAEIARAVLGQDPYNKYPKEDGNCAIVGYKERHIGMVIHKYLFRPGAFNIIRDAETNQWRVWRPWVPQDMARSKEKVPAPPLIPDRFIKDIAWKDKAKNVFYKVELTTGWTIYAFSSTAKPDQGFQLDLAHIDEDIINENWYSELVARLSIRNGKLRWTALPHNENDALNRVAERGQDEADDHARGGPEPTTVVIRATIYDNPFMPTEAREANIKLWKSKGEDEYRKRALGELVTDTIRMYPSFGRYTHSIQGYKGKLGGLFDEYLKTRQLSHNWPRSAIVDPGHHTCAVLFIATIKSEHGEFQLCYDELYMHQCDARMFGANFSIKYQGHWFQRFIIDSHGGAITSMDTGVTPQEAYERELLAKNITCQETGSRFERGCDQIAYRENELRLWLGMKACGVPTILYDFETCPNFEREMTRFKKLKIRDEVIDKGNRQANTHLVECCEYAAAHGLPYVEPPKHRKDLTPAQRWIQNFKDRQRLKAAKSRTFGRGRQVSLGPQGARSDS